MSTNTTGPNCSQCGRNRANDAGVTDVPHAACPDCGSTALAHAVHAHETVAGVAATITTSLRPGVQDRDWQLRWKQLQDRLPRVAGIRSEPRSADAIHSAAQDFFEFLVSAYHLKDALIQDQAVPENDVEQAITQSSTLSLLADLANLDKHRQLDVARRPRSGDTPVIEGVSDTSSGDGWELVVDIRHKDRVVNGVAFAKAVVEEWRKHFQGWGLPA